MNTLNQNAEMFTQHQVAEYIAKKLAVSERLVYDRWVHHPTFPKPTKLPSMTGTRPIKRWQIAVIVEWAEKQLKAA